MTARRNDFLIIALASASLVALEIAWTRILSAEFFYTFAFLILSLAILGLGLGGLALRLFPGLARPDRLGIHFLAAATLALAGPPAVLHLGLDIAKIFGAWAMAWRALAALALLGSAFFAGGMGVALLFRTRFRDMPGLYRADLAGAGLGALGIVLLMNAVETPRATVLLVLPLAAAAFLAGGRRVKAAALAVTAAALALLAPAPRFMARPRKELAPVVHRHWDATSLLKVNAFEDGFLNLNIDNAANTPLALFDGNWEAFRAQPFPALMDPKPLMDAMGGSCRFLSIGAGGGRDALLALRNGAAEVHAVEVNPYINRLLLPGGRYFEATGRMYADPRVKVVTEDARTYVRRNPGRFDLAFSLSSNSFAALASGAFAMSENYVFTTEAMRDYVRALSPRGFLIMEHQFYMPRIVSEALDGLRACGVERPERHIAVYAIPQGRYPRQVIVVGRQPLTPEQIRRPFLNLDAGDPKVMHRLYPDPDPAARAPIDRIVREGWRKVDAASPTDLSPATDDRPFIAVQGRLRNLDLKGLRNLTTFEIQGFPLAKVMALAVLAVALLLVLPLNALPWLRRGPRLGWAGWWYFFAIGFAYMAVEVVLIQKYTRFIGASAHTVAAILFALLAGSALGAQAAPRFRDRTPFLGILGWLALDAVLAGPIMDRLAFLPMALRAASAVAMLGPLAFFMGMPFPKGTAKVGECVDWGFAVNGAASVAGSAAVLLVAFQWGFTAALALGGLVYLGAGLLLGRAGRWVEVG